MPNDSAPTWRSPIATAGVFHDIPMEHYHGPREICPGPSISSSGLRKIENESLYHFWWHSPLNPDCPPYEDKPHFQLGKLIHDLLEKQDDAWRMWHVLPEGFSEAHNKKWADAIVERDAAVESGLQCIRFGDAQKAMRMAGLVIRHPTAQLMFKQGVHEPTLAWQDKETGVWLRVRPDFLPDAKRWIPDYKSTASAHPEDFAKSVNDFGYHMAAALYLEGLRVLFGERPKGFILIAQEKEEPHVTELYQLDEEAIAWGAVLNRRAMRKFADALASDKWPTYGNDINLVGLPPWRHRQLENEVAANLLEVPHGDVVP